MAQITRTKRIGLAKGNSFNQFNFDDVSLPAGASWTRFYIDGGTTGPNWTNMRDMYNGGALQYNTWYTDFSRLLINGTTPRLYFKNLASNWIEFDVTITLEYDPGQYAITYSAGTGGSLTGSASAATAGSIITLYPVANTGYQFSSWSSDPAVTITNNQFTMPASAITITANFSLVSYAVNKGANPAAGGSVSSSANSATMGTVVTLTPTANTGYQFSSWSSSPALSISNNQFTMPASDVSITANFSLISYAITTAVSPSGGGSVTSSVNSATMGTVVTLTPTPATGYQFSGWSSSPAVTITNNKFTMPASAVTITATFTKITYTISKAASPSAGGTVTTGANSATMGTSVSVSQTPNTGYYFNGWTTSPSLTISNGAFTMPASNVSITANYLKRSTASINKTTLTGGDSATLTISADKTTYTHSYKLSFGTNMETSWTSVSAGVSSVSISIPASWSNSIPNATSKTGGTLTVKTYSGSTEIGSYTISGLTYAVPASAKPTIGTITKSIARTIGGTTYANIGDIYTQGKCGVRVQTSASGSYSSTISSLKVELSGYSGSNYNKTVATTSIDFTTGLLTIAGTTTITVTATDSRGRVTTATTTISVTAYNAPGGTLGAWRVNSGGTADTMGIYAKYSLSTSYSAIGSNSLTVTLTSQGSSKSSPASTGDLLPNNRQTFSIQQEYTITLTLTDAFQTVTITAKVPSARFIIYVNNDGSKLGFMKAANKTIPSGKDSTVEFSANSQIYIGDRTLEDYIRYIVNNM